MTAPLQQELDLRLPGTHGGSRPGAGRPKLEGRRDADHLRRPQIRGESVFHISLRTLPDVPRLRQPAMLAAIRAALDHVLQHWPLRIVHTSIQHNHIHLIVEAEHRDILARGMQAFAIVAARGINRAAGRTGKVFAFRYHATAITSPRQMRNTLAYVLNNWRRHHEDHGSARSRKAQIDPYSTGIWFRHWRGVGRFAWTKSFEPLPMANPTAWLLVEGWLRHGAIDPLERPGPV